MKFVKAAVLALLVSAQTASAFAPARKFFRCIVIYIYLDSYYDWLYTDLCIDYIF